jgi:hypothetical protein
MESSSRLFHRRGRRISMRQPVRLTPSLPRGEFLEEITNTSNVSREGFYFLTGRDHYKEGMRLLVTLPYHSPRTRADRDYLAQIVRVEQLKSDGYGIAVQLLTSVCE